MTDSAPCMTLYGIVLIVFFTIAGHTNGEEHRSSTLVCRVEKVNGRMCLAPHVDGHKDVRSAKKLTVVGHYLPQKALEPFSKASDLTTLHIHDAILEENALEPLASCSRLKRLHLDGQKFEPEDLLPLYKYQCKLKALSFSEIQYSYNLFDKFLTYDEKMFRIPECMTTIEQFEFLDECDWFNEHYLDMFRYMPSLKRLRLYETGIKPKNMHRFPPSDNLEELILTGNAIVDQDLEALSRLTKVKTLVLNRTAISSQGLKHLTRLRYLEVLSLSENFKVRNDGVRHLVKLPRLKRLYLNGTGIDDGAMNHVANMSQLETLDITDTHVTDQGLFQIADLEHLREVAVKKDYPVYVWHLSEYRSGGDYLSSYVTMQGFEKFERMVGHELDDGGSY